MGPTGSVWAFEPASSTADLLAEGIAVNGFAQIVLERSALSSTCGTAQLSLNENSELNALVHGDPSTSASETVPLLTLDEWMKSHGGLDIDFMKIDAEGEEANILKGGTRFFAERSPLVQYEIKAGTELHMELVQDFAALGYESYRLVPGLDLLFRFDTELPPDGYLLNLFCCKPDRAAQLAACGFLLDSAAGHPRHREECIKLPQVDPSEPFLAPGERFDAIPPGDAIGNWVLASVLEKLERLSSFSSFYTGVSAHQRLRTIHALGFGRAEMTRRLRLLQSRFGLQPT